MKYEQVDTATPTDAAQKKCKRCLCVKDRSLFFKHTRAADGLSGKCKECDKAKTYAYRAANPGVHARIQAKYRSEHRETQLEANRRWVEAHPEYERERYWRRRANPEQLEKMRAFGAAQAKLRGILSKAGSDISAEDVTWMMAQSCSYCLAPACELDHVTPVSKGGTHTLDNVVPACRSCNARKSNKSLLEFLQHQRNRAERSRINGAHR